MRTVVVGAGRMGGRHVANALALGLDVVAVADVAGPAVEQLLSEHGLPPSVGTTDPAAALALGAEVVIVATTADGHADLVVAAAEGGAGRILCEKPMATSIADCRRMLDACAASGTVLAVNHQMRVMEQYVEVRRIVTSPAFGGLSSVTVVAGNFGLAMNGTHYLEMFRYMTGAPAARVQGWLAADPLPNPRGARFADRAGSIRAVTPDGTRFFLDAGHDQGHGVVVVYAGPAGHLVADELAGTITVTVRDEAHRDAPSTRYGMPSSTRVQHLAPADSLEPSRRVLAALVEGGDVPDGRDGMAAVRALVAAHVSDEEGHREVEVDDALPEDRTFPWA